MSRIFRIEGAYKMSSENRRKQLINILEISIGAVKGSELAKKLEVSRQVIVQDIALIRAKGYEIIATPQGYIIYSKNNITEYIKCNNHINDEEIYDEFKTIVDMGGIIKNVIVEHPTYGKLKAELNISIQRDILHFMEKVKNNEFKQLSLLSTYNHIHTIEASRKDIIDDIIDELNKKNILSK